MTDRWTYRQDQELPSFAVTWNDRDGTLINYASGYTFTVQLVNVNTGVIGLTKTTNITGAATAPNVIVAWATGELNIAVGDYAVHLKANNGPGTDRLFRPDRPPVIRITATPT